MSIFSKFLPYPFNGLSTEDLGQAEVVSTTCIWIIIVFFLSAVCVQSFRSSKLKRNIKRARVLLDKLRSDQLAAVRNSLDEQMDLIPVVGELWHEFNETLVKSRDGSAIYNTVDADHFFNPSTLGQGVADSRFISAVPGMLTALGVFGTFVGLQFGLDSLDLTTPDKMSDSMAFVVEGAATAFKTSVWGILASLAFNIVEKIIEGGLLKRIRTFQFRIDRLFDRTLGEQALVDIKGNTSESERLLRHLGEQIGEKVQEGISSAVGPHMEKLGQVMSEFAERQATGAETAMQDLVESFSEKLSNAGQQQAESMENSANSLTLAMDRLDKTIDSFLKEVASQITDLNEVVRTNQEVSAKSQERAEQVINNTTKSQEQFSEVSTEVANAATSLRSTIENLEGVNKAFSETVEHFATSQSNATRAFQSTVQSLSETTKSLDAAGERTEKFYGQISEAILEISEVTTRAQDAIASLPEKHQAVLNTFFTDLTQNLDTYKNSLGNLTVEFSEKLQGSTNHRINEWTANTQEFCNNMKDAVEFLNGTIIEMKDITSNLK
ncbi:anti-phage ZorAB system protein ZorA [Akkermansiaceae bacterium]|nr:anti-phage ZorAB system protein ZorA [Akkermansiaceae bacterium]